MLLNFNAYESNIDVNKLAETQGTDKLSEASPRLGSAPAPESQHRYVSKEGWRASQDAFQSIGGRQANPQIGARDPLTNVMLMIKTGATVLWSQLPVHLFTTLQSFPHFALYSDAPGSIGGFEVHDILDHVSKETAASDFFIMYKKQKQLHDLHANWEETQVPLDILDAGPYSRINGWSLDKFKNLPMIMHAYELNPNLDWYVFMDSDTYLVADNLKRLLARYDPNRHLYLGKREWYDSANGTQYRFAQGGSGVIISQKTMKEAYAKRDKLDVYEKQTIDEVGGDDMVAIFLCNELGVEVTHDPGFFEDSINDAHVGEGDWCHPVYSFHHMTPRDIEIWWEYEQVKRAQDDKRPILLADYYVDFILPYVADVVPHWNAMLRGTAYNVEENTEGTTNSPRPYASVEACKQACSDDDSCKCWSLRTGSQPECRVSSDIRVGQSHFVWQKSAKPDTHYTSGWMIDRIRDMRAQMDCDNPKDTLHEGWFRNSFAVSE